MRYDFTDRVRKSLAVAREEVIKHRHDFLAPAHMALGLLSADPEVMGVPDVDADRLRHALDRVLPPGKTSAEGVVLGELPYTSAARTALEKAMAEARSRKDRSVGTSHLLRGILAADPAVAAALEPFGIGHGANAPAEPDVWVLQVDAGSGTPLYEQIIQRVEEAVATSRLAEGERLPPVRELAAELEIAPGTVARAYQALEEKGVVVTEGARGTRVAPRASRERADDERASALEGLLRPAVVAAYHMGAKAKEVRGALERAMKGIYGLLSVLLLVP